jgi:hypothetical protein
MVLDENRAEFARLIRLSGMYAQIARSLTQSGIRGEGVAEQLNTAARLRRKAWELAKPICMMCWKDAQIMRQWRGPHIQGWCNKCAGHYPN